MRWVILAATLGVAFAGHNDMFQCRGKGACTVTELTDSNWAAEIGAAPHFVMFYAPWCGHCKTLAPKMKKAAQTLASSGLKIGAVDVEPNRNVQGMFSDIKGFPTLKFVGQASNPGKSSVSYDGPREAEAIAQWTKETAAKAGVSLTEPAQVKQFDELYTFFGRSALEGKPVLFAVGSDAEAPGWFNKLNSKLTEDLINAPSEVDEEAETKRLLKEAKAGTKNKEAKSGIDEVLKTLELKKKKSKPIYAAAYSSDPKALEAFSAGLKPGQVAIFVASLDRKNLALSALVPYGVVEKKKGKGPELTPMVEFFGGVAAAALAGPAAVKADHAATLLPDLPKPRSVLAAEERAAKKKASASEIAVIASSSDLDSKCYSLASSKTCTLAIVEDDSHDALLAVIAEKYAREGLSFAKIIKKDAPAAFIAEMTAGGEETPLLVLVKGGKRPRAARASGADLSTLLDAVLGGQGKFDKFSGGLPKWPAASSEEAPPAATDDEYDL